MCGRFSLKSTFQAIEDEFSIEESEIEILPRYNIAPTQDVSAIVNDGQMRLVSFRWGLIPSWAKDPTIGNKMINARAETLTQKVSFKNALKKRRCLIIADGFYEWKKAGSEKKPMFIFFKNEKPFAFAGLWESWKTPEGKFIRTCTIITTTPNELISPIHNRMPVILRKEYRSYWLEPYNSDETKLVELLKPYPPEEMAAYEVSKHVNSPKNDSPLCCEPIYSNT
ncbi:MAG: SOS response-associated peptidase [Bacteroidota bacterium]|nr:SOS response-associated peptidase [Bacteroidota bacterium]